MSTRNTGLLTGRCDPFGAESRVQLLGGVFEPANVGKVMWHCQEPAIGRYRFICRGGDYGFRRQNDGGIIHATHCDGGHRGQVMTLCRKHVRDFTVGPPKAGFTKDLKTPVGQVGGTVANELCPACAYPPEARELSAKADDLNMRIARAFLLPEIARLTSEQDQIRARLDELNETGVVHKCPLILREVS
jgi:hypothetical protein